MFIKVVGRQGNLMVSVFNNMGTEVNIRGIFYKASKTVLIQKKLLNKKSKNFVIMVVSYKNKANTNQQQEKPTKENF
jgi:hypothetical protein